MLALKSQICHLNFPFFRRLLHDEADGTFLVRPIDGGLQFVLSFVINNIVYNVKIGVENEHLELGGKPTTMETIYDMVEHFRQVPIYSEVALLDRPKWKEPSTSLPPINICEK